MPAYRVIALAQDVADAVRATRLSPFSSHPTHAEIARGHGPCRLCLRAFTVGEDRRILFTFDPFAGLEPLPLPGPVFKHRAGCVRGGLGRRMRQGWSAVTGHPAALL